MSTRHANPIGVQAPPEASAGVLSIVPFTTPELTRLSRHILTTSASGLDPDISPAAADAQVQRIAAARRLSPEDIRNVIRANTSGPDLGFLGERRVNVLVLNIALDQHSFNEHRVQAGSGATTPAN